MFHTLFTVQSGAEVIGIIPIPIPVSVSVSVSVSDNPFDCRVDSPEFPSDSFSPMVMVLP